MERVISVGPGIPDSKPGSGSGSFTGSETSPRGSPRTAFRRADEDPPWVRRLLIGVALLFLGGFLLVPAAAVLWEAFRGGVGVWLRAVTEPDARAAIRLTLLVAAIAVPLNTVFGVAAAWSVTRFRYPGKNELLSLIDLPFGVSPVISGMIQSLITIGTGQAR